jgi:hypothetical protein
MNKQNQNIVLSPAQQEAYEGLLNGSAAGDVLVLMARPGSGRTTIIHKLSAALGGAFLGIRGFMQSLSARRPEAIEEAFLQRMERALAHQHTVIVDDLHLVTRVVAACEYPRALLFDAAITAILGEAAGMRKKLIFAIDDEVPWPLARRASSWKVAEFTVEDYAALCRSFLGEAATRLDFDQVHRFAPSLTAGQLRSACGRLSHGGTVDTADLIRELEAKSALPFENDALSAGLGLKPKRSALTDRTMIAGK